VSSNRHDGGAWLDRMLGAAAAILLFCLMAVTTVDVIGRYIFNFPLRGGFEITELLLLTLIFAGLPLVSRADEHVTMDFIDQAFGVRGRRLLLRILVGPFVYFMALMVAVTAIVHLVRAVLPTADDKPKIIDPDHVSPT
jgi:TRAP-type C4-dicarboxylate transport system permease small subunit